jgi:type I restriction enzyme S subunit
MGLKIFYSNLKNNYIDEYFRIDTKYRYFADIQNLVAFKTKQTTELSNAISEIISNKFKKGDLDREYSLINLANIERRGNLLKNIDLVDSLDSDKNLLKNGDLVIPKMEPKKGQFFLNLEHNEYVGSTELIEYKINTDSYNPIFLYYLLTSSEFLKILDFLESGKTHRRVSSPDLLSIKIPVVSKEIQDNVASEIEVLEKEIKFMITSQKGETDIINQVLIEELGFNLDEFNSIKKKGVYSTSLFDFSENIDLRFSSKFHNPSHNYMHDFLIQKTNKRVKDFVSEPIVLGKSVSPSEYEEDGDCYYMSMATIKSWYFDSSESKSVSMDYERSNQNKKVAINDIIIARSGEGSIGKVALIDDIDINAVFADFTMRIRLEKYNYKFAYYYFRSIFFQHLVEHNKKGLGNNTNIFPSQIQEFPMLDFSLDQQQQIVDKIKTRIDEQQKYTLQIEEKRAEIEKIILETLTF